MLIDSSCSYITEVQYYCSTGYAAGGRGRLVPGLYTSPRLPALPGSVTPYYYGLGQGSVCPAPLMKLVRSCCAVRSLNRTSVWLHTSVVQGACLPHTHRSSCTFNLVMTHKVKRVATVSNHTCNVAAAAAEALPAQLSYRISCAEGGRHMLRCEIAMWQGRGGGQRQKRALGLQMQKHYI